jgi:rSAM/selenodomain-associated transferase 1
MAKFWTAGKVKTRLGRRVGMHQSARLHKLFVRVLTDRLASSADQRFAVVTPRAKARRLASQISGAWNIAHQSEGDLGDRMMHWIGQSLGAFDAAILIGADCPLIDHKTIEQASDQLLHHDVVLGPAIDGGYYLIGAKGPWNDRLANLFVDMPWSSDQVLTQTVNRCQANALAVALLEEREDIDTLEALDRLRNELAVTNRHADLLQQIDEILNDPWGDDVAIIVDPNDRPDDAARSVE